MFSAQPFTIGARSSMAGDSNRGAATATALSAPLVNRGVAGADKQKTKGSPTLGEPAAFAFVFGKVAAMPSLPGALMPPATDEPAAATTPEQKQERAQGSCFTFPSARAFAFGAGPAGRPITGTTGPRRIVKVSATFARNQSLVNFNIAAIIPHHINSEDAAGYDIDTTQRFGTSDDDDVPPGAKSADQKPSQEDAFKLDRGAWVAEIFRLGIQKAITTIPSIAGAPAAACYFPADTIGLLMELLPLQSRCRAMCVSRAWQGAANSTPSAWRICRSGPESEHMTDIELSTIILRAAGKLEALSVHTEHISLGGWALSCLPLGWALASDSVGVKSNIAGLTDLKANPLKHIDFSGCTRLRGSMLLANLPEPLSLTLRTIHIDGCALNHLEFTTLKARFPQCKFDVEACIECEHIAAPELKCLGCADSVCARDQCSSEFLAMKCGSKLCERGWCEQCAEDGPEDAPACGSCYTSFCNFGCSMLLICDCCYEVACEDCHGKKDCPTMMWCDCCYKHVCLKCMGKVGAPTMMMCNNCCTSHCDDCMGKKDCPMIMFCEFCAESTCMDCMGKKGFMMVCEECSEMCCSDCKMAGKGCSHGPCFGDY